MLGCPTTKESNPIAPKPNTEVTNIIVIDSCLTIENDLTFKDITIRRLIKGILKLKFRNNGYSTDLTRRPPSLFSAETPCLDTY